MAGDNDIKVWPQCMMMEMTGVMEVLENDLHDWQCDSVIISSLMKYDDGRWKLR
jgi:hypothetical protein